MKDRRRDEHHRRCVSSTMVCEVDRVQNIEGDQTTGEGGATRNTPSQAVPYFWPDSARASGVQ